MLFDDTALIARWQANTGVDKLWEHAQREGIPILLLATAVAAANARFRVPDEKWATMRGRNVVLVELTVDDAPVAARMAPDDLALGHASLIASNEGALVLTARPLDYSPAIRTREIRGF
jgi:hypothetical protein